MCPRFASHRSPPNLRLPPPRHDQHHMAYDSWPPPPPHRRSDSEGTLLNPYPAEKDGAELPSSTGWFGFMETTPILSLLSITLHGMLVGLHALLVVVWMRGWENRLTFSLQYQSWISLGITAFATTIGTVYSATLVFITQRLSTRRDLRRRQSLTATNDIGAAWTGIGSALAGVLNQRDVTSSLLGVLSAFIYLGAILALHITTPALLAIEAFNSTQLVSVPTQGLPIFSGVNVSDGGDVLRGISAGIATFPMLLYMDPLSSVGLHGSTLYDVLSANNGTGVASVNAYTFQMACGYVTDVNSSSFVWNDTSQTWSVTTGGSNYTLIPPKEGIMGMLRWTTDEDVVFYSTVPILDMKGATGPRINLSYPGPDTTASTIPIQLFRCSHTLIKLPAVVDVQSRALVALGEASPSSESARTWLPFNDKNAPSAYDLLRDGAMGSPEGFIAAWNLWYLFAPPSNYQSSAIEATNLFPFTDLFLNLDLGLASASASVRTSVTLLEMEASLAKLLASMYWILGHIQPTFGFVTDDNEGTIITNLTSLVDGRTTVTEYFVRGRLNLSILAVAGGLAASSILLIVSVQFLQFREWGRMQGAAQIDGTNLLHAIWLYRDHPALETLLEQVDNPTSINLRRAGMAQVRLIDRGARARESMEPLKGSELV
ncbi:hypothetical protein B0H19DRAFT_1227082 [Mycena capillaripes]|nr:hypothetical protein B0H19DRAFT_1227082 [Mycena capillaripes]